MYTLSMVIVQLLSSGRYRGSGRTNGLYPSPLPLQTTRYMTSYLTPKNVFVRGRHKVMHIGFLTINKKKNSEFNYFTLL